MAYIKKEQSVALTHPQRDLQIAVQGSQNTITQTARAGQAPALNSGDSIMTVLEEIAEGVAKFARGQATLLQKLEALREARKVRLQGLAILRQQQVRLIQRVGGLEDGITRLENGLDAIHQEVRGIRHDISRQ